MAATDDTRRRDAAATDLAHEIDALVIERQELRSHGASHDCLEANRLRLACLERRLSRAVSVVGPDAPLAA